MATEAEKNFLKSCNGHVPFYKFCLTGGPCGGKTTALARIYSFLRERGFEVITAPETFTIFASNGLSGDLFATEGMAATIQTSVMDTQIVLEDSLSSVLRSTGKPAVLLCDRGPQDGAAYLTPDEWRSLIAKKGYDEETLRDSRYDAIFHMVTAADGAESYYTLENNTTRTETPEVARELDKKTQRAWLGHPHMYVLDNSTDFEGKLQKLVQIISKIVGLPSNLARRSAKFLLRSAPKSEMFPPDMEYFEFDVEKVYILDQGSKDEYSFIRKRTTIDRKTRLYRGSVYQLTSVRITDKGEPIEQKRIISAREYNAAYRSRDPSRHIVRQHRISFLFNKQSFTIHVYNSPAPGLCILHAQVETPNDTEPDVTLPPFLDVERRLEGKDDESEYGAFALSLIAKKLR